MKKMDDTPMKMSHLIWLVVGLGLLPELAGAQNPRLPLPLERPAAVYDHTAIRPLSAEGGGSLVHVLAYNGVIHPPATDGTPHPSNTVLYTTHVGVGVDPNELPGAFSTSIIPRPTTMFFVRVYNAPTLEEATFYEDSDLHAPSVSFDVPFHPAMTATTNAIDTRDFSGDGINNSWKRALGLDVYATDTDGDGIDDSVEIAMGTDPLNVSSVVPPFMLGRLDGGTLVADWDLDAAPEGDVPEVLRQSMSEGISVSSDPYANFTYFMQASDNVASGWQSVKTGLVGEWPVYMSMTESTNAVQFYRVIMKIGE